MYMKIFDTITCPQQKFRVLINIKIYTICADIYISAKRAKFFETPDMSRVKPLSRENIITTV